MITRAHFALALALFAASACGLKGPLYSPDQRQEEVAPAPRAETPVKGSTTPIPAPQSQKKDRQRSDSMSVPSASDTATPAPTPDPDRPAAPPTVPPQPDQTSR